MMAGLSGTGMGWRIRIEPHRTDFEASSASALQDVLTHQHFEPVYIFRLDRVDHLVMLATGLFHAGAGSPLGDRRG